MPPAAAPSFAAPCASIAAVMVVATSLNCAMEPLTSRTATTDSSVAAWMAPIWAAALLGPRTSSLVPMVRCFAPRAMVAAIRRGAATPGARTHLTGGRAFRHHRAWLHDRDFGRERPAAAPRGSDGPVERTQDQQDRRPVRRPRTRAGGLMDAASLRALPAVDAVLRAPLAQAVVAAHGHAAAADAARRALAAARAALREGAPAAATPDALAAAALALLEAEARPTLRPVLNLTGTVLHTNLGRATLAEEAIAAAEAAMRGAVALEYDVATGRRGERDDAIRPLMRELTGAEDALVVNNAAGALVLALNTLALGRETVVSRGELIEIGGAFRLPDIMAQAGAVLREVGTTNRTHARDYRAALGEKTGLVLKVHTSNYRIEGFTAAVPAAELAAIAGEAQVPLVDDLGSGTLLDLSRWGLRREPTVREAVAAGADLVIFSGDKLLGGPQAGFVVGRAALVARLNRNPLKRALRLDKIRLAALEATLRLYRNPDALAQRLPTLRRLARPPAEIEAAARRVLPALRAAIGAGFAVEVAPCASQVGSGALPTDTLPSWGLRLHAAEGPGGAAPERLAAAFRALPLPVIGRVAEGAFWLDCRCLEDEAGFARALDALRA